MPAAVLFTALASLPVERYLISRVYRRPELDQALLTIGVAFVAIALVNLWLGASFSAIELPPWLSGPVDLGFRSFPRHRLAVIVLGFLVSAALWVFIERSRFGIRLRAAVDNAGIAQAVGINTTLLYSSAFAIGAGLAALGGIAGAELLPMEANYPVKYLVLFLAVVAVGGQGTLFGTFLAAILLGVVDTAAKYLLPDIASISFYLDDAGRAGAAAAGFVRPQGSRLMADIAAAQTIRSPDPLVRRGSALNSPSSRPVSPRRCCFPTISASSPGSTSSSSSRSRWRW